MAEAAVTRYWCHECEQAIEEAMVDEVKCPICDGGFVEEIIGQEFEALTSRQSESGRGLSQWGGMLDSPFDQPEATRDSDDEDDDDNDNLGCEFEGFIMRHRWALTLRRVLNSIQDGLRVDRERDNSVLINAFNQALALQGSVLDPDDVQGDQGGSNNDDGLLEEYAVGAGLSLLLQQMAENDPNRYGTPPAKKEVVEALPAIQIEEAVSCSVCLDDLERGSQAK
jgi:E3 ubiquitin-protein ligase RNF115/126